MYFVIVFKFAFLFLICIFLKTHTSKQVQYFENFLEPRLAGQRLTYHYLSNASSAHYGTDPNENMLGLHPMWEYSNPNYTVVRAQHCQCIAFEQMSSLPILLLLSSRCGNTS